MPQPTPLVWWQQKLRPANENGYFENLSRVIFQSGKEWKKNDQRWHAIKTVFNGFAVDKVAESKVEELVSRLKSQGISVRISKIQAVIRNAIRFQITQKVFGSFQAYIDGLDKTGNYAGVVNDLTNKFESICPYSASVFLRSVGENINPY